MTIYRRGSFSSSSFKCDSLASFSEISHSDTEPQTGNQVEDPAAVNAKIEAQLRRDTKNLRKEESGLVKILLLGQAGSGKSTTLKNFRMQFTRDEWERERLGWRAIVQFNIVRQVLSIIQIVNAELGGNPFLSADDSISNWADDVVQSWISGSNHLGPPPSQTNSPKETSHFTDKHRHLITRLSSRLSEVELELNGRLTPYTVYYPAMIAPLVSATPFESGEEIDDDVLVRKKVIEYTFRTWRDVLHVAPQMPSRSTTTALTGANPTSSSFSMDSLDRPTQAIAELREDIRALWTDAAVRTCVKRRRLDIPDSIGFDSEAGSNFLDEIDRIAQVDYEVSDQDIVHARLKTVGIQEYTFSFDTGAPTITGSRKLSWRIYDVGGCRTMRKAWLPYFDNVQLIIFLAPVSAFDERLEEDPRINRLQDSITLWSCICETALLANSKIILFMNKCDLLQKKLERGVLVARYMSSYGKRPNDPKQVIRYIREKFKTIHEEKSPSERPFSAFPTTVTDTSATALTLRAVRDSVIRQYLTTTQFM